MKFSVSLAEFQRLLDKVVPVIPSKSTIPVLEHLKISVSNNIAEVVSTDQEITILARVDVNAETEGKVLVPAKKLNEILKALGNTGEIIIDSNSENHDVNIKTSFGKYGMKGLDSEEFIDLPELFQPSKPDFNIASGDGSGFILSKDELNTLTEKTLFAVSNDEFRPAMMGVLFQFRGEKINAVATDSFRLVRSVIKKEPGYFPNDLDIIIPARAINLLRKVDNEVKISVIEKNGKITHTRFEYGSTIMVTRVLDEKFPPYESVLPTNNEFLLYCDKPALLSAVKRVALFTNATSKQVKLDISSNNIKLIGEDEDGGTSAEENISCDFNGESILVGFNFKYLEDAVTHCDSGVENTIVLTFSEPNKPVLVQPTESSDGLLMLIMPVRLTS